MAKRLIAAAVVAVLLAVQAGLIHAGYFGRAAVLGVMVVVFSVWIGDIVRAARRERAAYAQDDAHYDRFLTFLAEVRRHIDRSLR